MSATGTAPLRLIRADPAAWPRAELDAARVADFVDLYRDEGLQALPPLEVVPTGTGPLLLADGWHRHAALRRLDVAQATVTVVEAAGRDPVQVAFERGLLTCTTSAKPLTRVERRAAVVRLITEDASRTDVSIARMVGVSPQTVGRVRRALTAPPEEPAGEDPEEAGSGYVRPALPSPEQVAHQLVKGFERLWDARTGSMLLGLSSTAKLGDALGVELVEQLGIRRAETWLARVATWTGRAADVVARAKDEGRQ